MKKTDFLLISIILLFGIFTAKAQDEPYHPLVQEGKVWSVLSAEETYNPNSPILTYSYQTFSMLFSGDTTINDVLYKKMYASTKKSPVFPKDYSLQNFMREDEDKKVWYLRSDAWGVEWEELLYDFSFEIGDTVCYGGSNSFIIVEDISDEIMHNGEVRKVFHFSRNGAFIMEDYWIEGIGSNYGLLIPFGSGIAGGFYKLLCFRENGNLMFYNEEYQTCYKNSVGVNTYNNQVDIYPNPATNFINITGDRVSTVKMYNNIGQLILTQHNTNTINVSALQNGIYLLTIESSTGNMIQKKIIKN